jgi:hypothetical protein
MRWCTNKYFAFLALLVAGVSLQAEKSETPFFSAEADLVGFCLTAQTDMSLLYNSTNERIIRGFRTFSPYYNFAAYAEIEISPDSYNSLDISYLGPLRILHRNLFNRTTSANLGQVFTDPFITDDWSNLYRYEYKDLMEINLFTGEYWYHITPRFVDYFSCSLSAQLRLQFLKDEYDVKSSDGIIRNLMNIKINDDMVGTWLGFRFNGRPVTRWSWDLVFGGAVYSSWIEKSFYLQDNGGSTIFSTGNIQRVAVSGTVDGDLGVEYCINSFAFKVDFWGSFYFGIPTAGGQLSENRIFDQIYSNSVLTFLGVKVGCVSRW